MKIKIAEIFYSIQGEGRFAGVPSVFLRTFGCNFQCRGFGMARGERTTEPEKIAENIDQYKTYEDLPLSPTGCDSYASWHPAFKKFSPMLETSEIADRMHNMIPMNMWKQPNGADVHLVVTGGEPLLGWQKAFNEVFDDCISKGLHYITFETNGTQKLHPEMKAYLQDYDYDVTFSVSAKLPVSGEKWEDAIKPDNILEYAEIGTPYLKFVTATEQDVEDVDRAVVEYRNAGFQGDVFIMPVGGLPESYHLNTKAVAELAMNRGYKYSPRLQVDIWRNEWGT